MSNPASRSAAALSSSLALHQMNSRMSGWSTSSTTILAARRVLPPDLIVPAHESAPRMKETGPEAVPPLASGSIDPRMLDRLMPEPEPPRKMRPSRVFQSRIESIVSSTREDEAGRALRGLLEAHVEPDRRIERRDLVQQDVASARPRTRRRPPRRRSSRAHDPSRRSCPTTRETICLTERSRVGDVELPAEVLLGDDVGRVLRPRLRELDVLLPERADGGGAQLPLHRVERMHARPREQAPHAQGLGGPMRLRERGLRRRLFHGACHLPRRPADLQLCGRWTMHLGPDGTRGAGRSRRSGRKSCVCREIVSCRRYGQPRMAASCGLISGRGGASR